MNLWAYGNRGYCYQKLKQYERAIEDLNKSIELDPDYLWAYCIKGVSYLKLKQYRKMVKSFKDMCKNETLQNAIAELKICIWMLMFERIYRAFGLYNNLIKKCDKLIELNPKESYYYSERGNVYKEMGEKDKAIADFQKALELDPANKDAKKGLRELEG